MNIENFPFSNLAWVLMDQGVVAWIYLTLIICLTTRVWISMKLLTLPVESRQPFLDRTYTLSESTGNASVLLGVMGTVIGVAVAVSGKIGSGPLEFIETFSNAFGIAVSTTIAGGLNYIVCLVLSSLDEYKYIVGEG